MLTDPDDLIGESEDPEIRAALQRLSDRQRQLTEITKEIVENINENAGRLGTPERQRPRHDPYSLVLSMPPCYDKLGYTSAFLPKK